MSDRHFLILALVALIFSTPIHCIAGAKATLGIDQMIYVEVKKQNCEVELYVNGIPMSRSSTDQPSSSIPVHQYLIDGANEIEIVINPGPTPLQARTT